MLIDDLNPVTDGGDSQAEFDDDPIGSLSAVVDDDEQGVDGNEGGEKKETTDTSIPTHIQAAIDKAHDEAIGAKQENQFLRGQLTTLQEQLKAPKTETKVEE